MKFAADFRQLARDALKGRWGIAVVAGLIASLLGAVGSGGPQLNVQLNDGDFHASLQIAGQNIISSNGDSAFLHMLTGIGTYIAVFAIVIGIALFILGSVVAVGYARFNLDLLDRQKEAGIGTVFSYFSFWKTTACARFLKSIYVLLWSLLLIIPGIIAGYSYAMTSYILANNPELTASEAIVRSKEMMYGNRWRLFCMQISFIGWEILSAVLTVGIGSLWVRPYKQAATAAFYQELSGSTDAYTRQ